MSIINVYIPPNDAKFAKTTPDQVNPAPPIKGIIILLSNPKLNRFLFKNHYSE
jgi:hypothetical protein